MDRAFVIALVLSLAYVMGQTPLPCKTPPQFHARVTQYDHGEDIMRRFNFQYDETNMRLSYVEEEIEIYPGRKFFKFLMFFRQNIAYQIDLLSKECTKIDLPKFNQIGIPPNATFETEYNIGGPSDYVTIQDWSDRIPYRKSAEVYVTFTVKDCFPVRVANVRNGMLNSSITTEFFNIVEGVPFPTDFIVPQECYKADYVPSKYTPKVMFYK